jgi:hypothetical protein
VIFRACVRSAGTACEGTEGAGKARYAAVAVGCAMRILRWALGILFLLLAPKLLRKARRGKKAAHWTRAKAPKQVKKIRRVARRSILPKRRRTLPL